MSWCRPNRRGALLLLFSTCAFNTKLNRAIEKIMQSKTRWAGMKINQLNKLNKLINWLLFNRNGKERHKERESMQISYHYCSVVQSFLFILSFLSLLLSLFVSSLTFRFVNNELFCFLLHLVRAEGRIQRSLQAFSLIEKKKLKSAV